jgi:hypothetical protein
MNKNKLDSLTLDEILDKYWDDIVKDEELVTTIQDRAKNYILEVIRLNNKGESK